MWKRALCLIVAVAVHSPPAWGAGRVAAEKQCKLLITGEAFPVGTMLTLSKRRGGNSRVLGVAKVVSLTKKGAVAEVQNPGGDCRRLRGASARQSRGEAVEKGAAGEAIPLELGFGLGADMIDKLLLTNAKPFQDQNNHLVSQRQESDAKGRFVATEATLRARVLPTAWFLPSASLWNGVGLDLMVRYGIVLPKTKVNSGQGTVLTSALDCSGRLLLRYDYGRGRAFSTTVFPLAYLSRSISHKLAGIPDTFEGISSANLEITGVGAGLGQSANFGNAHLSAEAMYVFHGVGTITFPLGSGNSDIANLAKPKGLVVNARYGHRLFSNGLVGVGLGYEKIGGPVEDAGYSDEYASSRIHFDIGADFQL